MPSGEAPQQQRRTASKVHDPDSEVCPPLPRRGSSLGEDRRGAALSRAAVNLGARLGKCNIRRRRGEIDREHGALALGALGGHVAVHRAREVAADGQAETDAAGRGVVSGCALELDERRKDPLQVIGGDADPAVADANADAFAIDLADRAPRRCRERPARSRRASRSARRPRPRDPTCRIRHSRTG